MSLPSPEQIKKVTDVANLQEACLSLIRLCEKERESKKQYRQAASTMKQEKDIVLMEMECLKQKNQALMDLASNQGNDDLEKLRARNEELEKQIDCLRKGELSQIQSEFENQLRQENEELKKRLHEDTAARDLQEQLAKKDETITQLNAEQQTILGILESNKAKAKERIEKLKQTINEMTETHQSEVEELSNQLHAKTQEIEELNSTKRKALDANKERINKLRTQKKSLKQKVESLKTESDLQKEKIDVLETRNHDDEMQNNTMLQKITELQKKLQEKDNSRELNASLSTTIQKLNMEIFELKQNQRGNEEFENAVNDRDATIAKLKSQIQILTKLDSDKSAKITELQEEICDLTSKVALLSSGAGSDGIGIARVEREKAILEEKLQHSQASEELMKKNRRLNEMIEKSNRLYAQLKEENQDLKRRLEVSSHSAFHFTANEIFSVTTSSKTTKKANPKKKLAQSAYLRRVILQFFTEDGRNRQTMIPVILKLIGCEDEQIAAVERQWQRSSSLISGLFGF